MILSAWFDLTVRIKTADEGRGVASCYDSILSYEGHVSKTAIIPLKGCIRVLAPCSGIRGTYNVKRIIYSFINAGQSKI